MPVRSNVQHHLDGFFCLSVQFNLRLCSDQREIGERVASVATVLHLLEYAFRLAIQS